MSRAPSIRIVIVEDHPVVRKGLRAVLGGQSDMTVVGEAASAAEAVALLARESADVVLLDLRLPDASGTEGIAALLAARPGSRILVLSSWGRPGDVRSALDAGAAGYVVKDAADEEVVGAVRKVAAGGAFVSQAAARALAGEGDLERLTAREQRILELMAEGHTNEAIARALDLSVGTVKNYIHVILLKLHVKDRTAAVAVATRSGRLKPR
jgi:DNA-binding NarL/FixJ family response regulator